VVIDDTPETANVPERFLAAHWTRLSGGKVTPELARRLCELTGRKAPQ